MLLNECSVVDCSRRPDQPHKISGCRVVALAITHFAFYVTAVNECKRFSNSTENGRYCIDRKVSCDVAKKLIPSARLLSLGEG